MCFSQEVLDHEREVSFPEDHFFEEIDFENEEEKFTLSGTLISPESGFDKVLVIVPGTGKDGRNSHFKLVDSLLRNNVAVFRYDERGVGKSQGNYFNLYLFSEIRQFNDVYYCLRKLRSIDALDGKKIGVLGHSEGGIASIEAHEDGAKIDFFIQWATPVRPYEIIRYQYDIGTNPGFFESLKISDERKGEFIDLVNIVVQSNLELKNPAIRKEIVRVATSKEFKRGDFKAYLSNTLFISFLKKDYESSYRNLSVPTLYIIGAKDEMVDPIENSRIVEGLNNSNIEVSIASDLYHMLKKKRFSSADPEAYLMDDFALNKIVQRVVSI